VNDNINLDITIAGSVKDNINMDITIAGSVNDNINMDITIGRVSEGQHKLGYYNSRVSE
jgi:hypothetical protein